MTVPERIHASLPSAGMGLALGGGVYGLMRTIQEIQRRMSLREKKEDAQIDEIIDPVLLQKPAAEQEQLRKSADTLQTLLNLGVLAGTVPVTVAGLTKLEAGIIQHKARRELEAERRKYLAVLQQATAANGAKQAAATDTPLVDALCSRLTNGPDLTKEAGWKDYLARNAGWLRWGAVPVATSAGFGALALAGDPPVERRRPLHLLPMAGLMAIFGVPALLAANRQYHENRKQESDVQLPDLDLPDDSVLNTSLLLSPADDQSKTAGLGDWFRQEAVAPVMQGMIDKSYGGLATYDGSQGMFGQTRARPVQAVRTMVGLPGNPSAPADYNFLQKGMYNAARAGSTVANQLPGADWARNKILSGKSDGVFGVNDSGKIKTNWSAVPGAALNWVKANPGMATLGAGVTLAGGLLLSRLFSRRKQDNPSVVVNVGGPQAPKQVGGVAPGWY